MANYPRVDQQPALPLPQAEELERQAQRIAWSEGRSDVTTLDRIRASRELEIHMPETGGLYSLK